MDHEPTSPQDPSSLLTPRAAALAKQLELFARTRVEGFLKSTSRSRLKGQSTDFRQHRPYAPGDDLRNLDWRILARADRLVTREYEEYTNLDVVLGVDFSGSMGYQGHGMRKIDFARRCAAMLAYLLGLQRDAVGLATLATDVRRMIPPGTSRKHIARVLAGLCEAEPSGETDVAACVQSLMQRIRRRSLFVFLSDCYQEPTPLTRALGMLRMKGHDVILYQVVDPTELDLTFAGVTLFRDLETGQIDAADPAEIRRAYREVADEHTRRLETSSQRYAIEFRRLPVSDDWDTALASLLRKRATRS